MSTRDVRGNPVSTTDLMSLDRLDEAIELFHGYFNDPLAVIDAAIADDPDFVMGHCFRAGLLATTTEKACEPMMRESVEAAEALWTQANDRERGHIVAARAWLDGRLERAVRLYGDILVDNPRDAFALQVAHLGDFYLGQQTMLRDRVARVLPDWNEDVPGYGYVLGMYAFGLEETGNHAAAEETGRRAVAMTPRDAWAVHAVAHVMEMQGRTAEGIDWLTSTSADWAPENMFAYHNWWHLSLYHLDRMEPGAALALYDARIRPEPSDVALEMVDASALLWRLHLAGVDVGDRWDALADAWEKTVDDGFYAFNDVHAMMAFAATRRTRAADRLLETMIETAKGDGTNAMMTRMIGLPVGRAIDAFGKRNYRKAVDHLERVRPMLHRFGGSNAQRDVFHLTLVEAAIGAGRERYARMLASERVAMKPESPHNRMILRRARPAEALDAPAATRNAA